MDTSLRTLALEWMHHRVEQDTEKRHNPKPWASYKQIYHGQEADKIEENLKAMGLRIGWEFQTANVLIFSVSDVELVYDLSKDEEYWEEATQRFRAKYG